MSSSSVFVVVNGSTIDSVYADEAAAVERCHELDEDGDGGSEVQSYDLVGGTVNVTAVKKSKSAAAPKKAAAKASSAEPKATKAAMKKTDTPAEQRAANAAKAKKTEGNEDIPDNVKALLAGSGSQLSGLQICVTGVPPTIGRKNAEQLVQNYGAKLMKSLSKKTDYVVVGDEAGPKKLDAIESLGIKTLDEGELIEMIESGGSNKRGADEDMDVDEDDEDEEEEKPAKSKRQKK
ncbi:putative replication factor C subunit 1 [Xylogone sp. PMI_703]|nr:putative replication factor C subunit 1 [Xylogone sp. PMI_703]